MVTFYTSFVVSLLDKIADQSALDYKFCIFLFCPQFVSSMEFHWYWVYIYTLYIPYIYTLDFLLCFLPWTPPWGPHPSRYIRLMMYMKCSKGHTPYTYFKWTRCITCLWDFHSDSKLGSQLLFICQMLRCRTFDWNDARSSSAPRPGFFTPRATLLSSDTSCDIWWHVASQSTQRHQLFSEMNELHSDLCSPLQKPW